MLSYRGVLYTDGQDLCVQLFKLWVIFLQLAELRPAGASTPSSVEHQGYILLTLVSG